MQLASIERVTAISNNFILYLLLLCAMDYFFVNVALLNFNSETRQGLNDFSASNTGSTESSHKERSIIT